MSDVEENHEGDIQPGEGEENAVEEKGVPLTKETITKCLSRLERTGDGSAYAYVKLDASKSDLNDIAVLSDYSHIRYATLSSNKLDDLSALSQMKFLLSLDCNRNNLSTLNLPSFSYLQLLDLSFNKLIDLTNCNFPMLKTLNLNTNNTKLSTLPSMENLESLSLRDNNLESFEGLHSFPKLKKLYAAKNRLKTVELPELPALETLHVRENQLSSLNFLSKISNLVNLNVRANEIPALTELDYLDSCKRYDFLF
ncbi:Oidioi.mRNA.OKI2018_I69.PAR.g11776.t1.cds [Oikopleura dioica]|uniref:Oidioi.mRNA.OKI2018_I69.PAR.g11776.t1.cds n=1 Tax=Oikopleura dioica TaxID=34765 RepID=A0ABN7S0J8_OIKDI|nr:Oidioi.mRNA.OKI2018_I69.PAR.g11776.t1.cds [Oikopleura dioica]